MFNTILLSSLLVLCSLIFAPAHSYAGEFSASVGEAKSRWYFRDQGELPSKGYRLAYIHPTKYEWQFDNTTSIRLELEVGIHHWTDTWLRKDKYGVFLNPMWRYYVPVYDQKIYFGAGIGLAYTNADDLLDRELGSRLLFEDKFELGIILAQKHRISVSVNHYSNANLADINHGVNFHFINYAYAF